MVPAELAGQHPVLGTRVLVWAGAAVCAAFAILFLYAAVSSFRTQRVNGGWPRRYGVAIGASGVTLHIPGTDRQFAWEEIVSIEPDILFRTRKRRRDSAAIKIAWNHSEQTSARTQYAVITADSLDVSPRMLLTALQHYWAHPQARSELGTTTAQRRMEAWARACRRTK